MSGILNLIVRGGAGVYLQDITTTRTRVDPANATSGFRLDTDGTVVQVNDAGDVSTLFTWLLGGVASSYHVKLVTGTGTLSAGTADTWQQVTVDKTFSVSQTVVGEKVFTGTLQLSADGGSTVLDSCAVSMTATVIT